MKLRTLAIAVAAASISVSAQAVDVKVNGDISIGYHTGNDTGYPIDDLGSEVTIKISEKAGGLTYFASTELDFNKNALQGDTDIDSSDDVDNFVAADELRFGVKGAFGELVIGDMDNACDKLEAGGNFGEFAEASDGVGDCNGEDEGTILYTKKMGKATVGVSHNVKNDQNSMAVQYRVNKGVKVALGYTSSDKVNKDETVSGSVTAKRGPIELKARVNNSENGLGLDTGYSAFLGYHITSKDLVHIGTTSDDNNSIGYKRKLSKKANLFVEYEEFTKTNTNAHAVGVMFNF